jgi:hypothetical protein
LKNGLPTGDDTAGIAAPSRGTHQIKSDSMGIALIRRASIRPFHIAFAASKFHRTKDI